MKQTQKQKIGIVGLGLIGGSIALALKEHCFVVGVDTDSATQDYCKQNGIVDRLTNIDGLKGCEIIFVSVPLAHVADTVRRVYAAVGEGSIITDTGSVKGMLAGQAGRIVGGHPMAGTEHSGIVAAKSRLLENAYYCLVSYAKTAPKDVERVEALVTKCFRSRPVRMTAEQHDAAVARLSHLPHTVAYALADTALGDGVSGAVAGTGFMDTTRIACSDPDFWTSVARMNRDNLLREMQAYARTFDGLCDCLEKEDYDGLRACFTRAKTAREKLTLRRAYASAHILEVDVPDEVGSIGRISTLLAEGGVNLSNIQIVHSREGANGALRLEIEDEAGYVRAKELLAAAYSVVAAGEGFSSENKENDT